MFSPGGEEATNASPALALGNASPGSVAADALLSPALQVHTADSLPAYELKFLIPESLAREVQVWAARAMRPDSYANPEHGGAYQTTTLYLDTPDRHVFHRAPGHKRRKYRIRRYGQEARAYLECKTRKGDRVNKRRSDIALDAVPVLTLSPREAHHADAWFCERVRERGFGPACLMTYERTAFVQASVDGPLRLTLDRRMRGQTAQSWDLTPLPEGSDILDGQVVCECKFRGGLPGLFKELIQSLRLETGSVSKYRRMMVATGAIRYEDGPHV